jgi:aspartyl-tRNA(Asn)/glutamyl-tRNA(Gln) amidotransferase subunit B
MSGSLIKTIANIITTTLISYSAKTSKPIQELIKKEDLIYLAKLFEKKDINNQGLLKAIQFLIDNPTKNAEETVIDLNLIQVSDDSVLIQYVEQAINNNPKQVEEYKSGKLQIIGFLVGQCMTLSNKTGNPAKFKELLESKLKD